jgi:hypothetical protein
MFSKAMMEREYSSCLPVRLSFLLEQSTRNPLICWEIDIGPSKMCRYIQILIQ